MVEISVIVNTFLWTFMIAAISTDFFNGRFDFFGPYPRRPFHDKSQVCITKYSINFI